eukprot:scaffold34531_cov31-Tisochrysis_lutea.AAC.2
MEIKCLGRVGCRLMHGTCSQHQAISTSLMGRYVWLPFLVARLDVSSIPIPIRYTYDRRPGGGIPLPGGGVIGMDGPDSPSSEEQDEDDFYCGVAWHAPYHTDPLLASTLPLRCRLLLGTSGRSAVACRETLRVLARLEWPFSSYNLVDHNCHHWSAAAARALGVTATPAWLNRAARLLGFISGASDTTKKPRQQTHRDLESPADPAVSPWEPREPRATSQSCCERGSFSGSASDEQRAALQPLLRRDESGKR